MATEPLSVREYAKTRGRTFQSVYDAINEGRINKGVVYDNKGRKRIDPEIADDEWDVNTDQSKALGRAGTRGLNNGANAAAQQSKGPTYNQSRAVREVYTAKLAKLEFEIKTGQSVSIDSVRAEAFSLGRRLQMALLAIPDRIASQIRSTQSDHEARELLREQISEVLAELNAEHATRR